MGRDSIFIASTMHVIPNHFFRQVWPMLSQYGVGPSLLDARECIKEVALSTNREGLILAVSLLEVFAVTVSSTFVLIPSLLVQPSREC